MGRLIDELLRRLTRTGMRRGLAGEHWAWLLIACTAYVLRRARNPKERSERIDLRRGDRYLVTLQSGAGDRRPRAGADAGGLGGTNATGADAGGFDGTNATGGAAEGSYRPHPTMG